MSTKTCCESKKWRLTCNNNNRFIIVVFSGPNSPPNTAATPNARDALAALELSRLTLWNLYGGASLPDPNAKAPPQQEALNLEVPTRIASEGAQTPKVPHNNNNNIPTSPRSTVYTVMPNIICFVHSNFIVSNC